jgi:uncharacterized membrane protein YphA (DoxX/SURF4 family)
MNPLKTPPFDNTLNIGRIIYTIGTLGLGVLCLIFRDFIVGRPPAWSFDATLLGYLTGAILIVAVVAMYFGKTASMNALLIAFMILLLSVIRHLPQFMVDWVNAYKALALLGGALILAVSFLQKNNVVVGSLHVGKSAQDFLLIAGTVLVASFFIAGGYAHFKWAEGVQFLIPEFIPFRLFWTYFCGVCLIAGGIGILIPFTRKPAALLSGIMVLGWFFLLHIPRVIANPADPSDRLGLFESFTFAGIFFVMAAVFSKK